MSHIIPKTFRELRDEYQRVHVGIDPNSLGEFGKHERDIFREVVDDIDRILGITPDAVTEANALCQAIRERDALRKQVENWSNELADALGCVNEHNVAPPFGEMVEKARRLRNSALLSAHRELDKVDAGNRSMTVADRIRVLAADRDGWCTRARQLEPEACSLCGGDPDGSLGGDGRSSCTACRNSGLRTAELEEELAAERTAHMNAISAAAAEQTTLRDQVAMAALQGLLAAVQFNPDQGSPYAPITTVSDALAIADTYLRERSK